MPRHKFRARAAIEAWLVSEMRLVPAPSDGFVLGFAGHDTEELITAATALGRAVRSYLRGSTNIGAREARWSAQPDAATES